MVVGFSVGSYHGDYVGHAERWAGEGETDEDLTAAAFRKEMLRGNLLEAHMYQYSSTIPRGTTTERGGAWERRNTGTPGGLEWEYLQMYSFLAELVILMV